MSGAPAREVDVIVVGASLAAAAAAKRLSDAGLESVVLERKKLPRHKVLPGDSAASRTAASNGA